MQCNPINILQSLLLPKNPCVIFDIDDTIISWPSEIPIKYTLNIYGYCLNNGITPIFVTARVGKDHIKKSTMKSLNKIGIYNPIIFYRDDDKRDIPLSKLYNRQYIKNMGYNTIMSIGDQPWDIGKYGGIGIIVKYTFNNAFEYILMSS